MLIAESARFWDRDRFDYRVAYMLPWKDHFVQPLSDRGVEVECLDWERPPGLAAARRLQRIARAWQPDIVHSHLPAAGVLARLTVLDSAHVYTEHNIVSSYRRSTRLLNRVSYSRNRAVITVSDAVAGSIANYPGPRPTVVPNGVAIEVSPEEASRARSELGLETDDPLVVHVGNVRPHKGHQTLVDAAHLLLQDIPNATVISIGAEKHAGALTRLRERARDLGIEDRLRFLGGRDDARSFLAAADVVVNPADVEGLPITLLEALALAKPVVATSVGGVPSVIHHESTGLLVSPGRPEELASALARALTSPEAADWGNQGALVVGKSFGLDRMVAAYEALYESVIDG